LHCFRPMFRAIFTFHFRGSLSLRALFRVTILGACVTVLGVRASSDCGRALTHSIFEASFHDISCYRAQKCHVNIFKLLGRIQKAGGDISQGKVLIIPDFHQFGTRTDFLSYYSGEPQQDRANVRITWGFHTVLLINGEILEFDFGNKATPLPTDSYARMALGMYDFYPPDFHPDRMTPERMVFEIPASDLLKNFYSDKDLERLVSRMNYPIKVRRPLPTYVRETTWVEATAD
jgi:hypothetical protein